MNITSQPPMCDGSLLFQGNKLSLSVFFPSPLITPYQVDVVNSLHKNH